MDDYFSAASDEKNEAVNVFDLQLKDDQLVRLVSDSMTISEAHWNGWPYNFGEVDKENIRYWLGDQMADGYKAASGRTIKNMGNKLQSSGRSILAYVNARVANPEVSPSSSRAEAKQFARDLADALKQHAIDQDIEEKCGKATQALFIQKRAYFKLRYDPMLGEHGDIAVDYVPPEDIIIDKDTAWGGDPFRIWHKQECTIEELCIKFPDKEDAIKKAYDIVRGTYKQMSRRVTHYEVWFTHYDNKKRGEAVCWYLPHGQLILGKMKNPNYIYTGDDAKDRQTNFFPFPPKPFVIFSYMNTGKGALDETSLFDQAKVLQDLYNTRRKQIFVNNQNLAGRDIVDKEAINEEDAVTFLKNQESGRAVLMVTPPQGKSIDQVHKNVPHNPLPGQAYEEALDIRNQIDSDMGTPNIFRGEGSNNNTLGQDDRIIEQASALQDDLARAVDKAMQRFYRLDAHMMRVYYTEDHWFTIKSDTGTYDYIVMNGDTMDANAKVSVEAGSTLPSNKYQIYTIATAAMNAGKIDDLSYWEAMAYGKLPDPETIVERLQKQQNDPASYMAEIAKEIASRDAMIDISLLIAQKDPPERDEYNADYMTSFNNFIMGNRFIQLPDEAQEAIKLHIATAGALAARTANLDMTQEQPVMGMEGALMDQESVTPPEPLAEQVI